MIRPPIDEGEQKCRSCHVPQPLSEFDRRRSEAFGRRYTYAEICKTCKKRRREQKKATDLPKEFYLPI